MGCTRSCKNYIIQTDGTVICENFIVKEFYLAQNAEIFLLVILYTANIWSVLDMNENIVTQKFLWYTHKF